MPETVAWAVAADQEAARREVIPAPITLQTDSQALEETGSLTVLGVSLGRAVHRDQFSRSALPTTLSDDRLIAAAAIMGDSSQPVSGYSNPAAIGTPRAL